MKALVIGRAGGVWEEVKAARELTNFDVTILIGRAGVDYTGEIDHWASWHADLLIPWAEERKRRGGSVAKNYWSGVYKGKRYPRGRRKLAIPVTYLNCKGGSSGFLGALVALEVKATRVVLAGIPMDPDRAHYDKLGAWNDGLKYRRIWVEEASRLAGKVKSMSGWTANLLGTPSKEWLESTDENPVQS